MKKKGSAILTVIGAVSILIVLAFAFIGSSRDKAGLSKLASDEKKCEALAESATDFIIQYIKKNANNHKDDNPIPPVYYLLRAPLKKKASGSGSGENAILDVSDTKKLDLADCIPFMNIIDPSIKEFEWDGKVEVTATCELCNAEAFTPFAPEYKVTTIDCEHMPAKGNSAKFLDDINSTCSEGSSDWLPSQWHVQFKFPEGNPTEEVVFYDLKIELSIISGLLSLIGKNMDDLDIPDVSIKISRSVEDSPELSININLDPIKNFKIDFWGCEVLGGPWYPFKDICEGIEELTTIDINIQKEINKAHFFPEIPDKSLPGFKQAVTEGNMTYNFNKYKQSMIDRKNQLKYDSCMNSFSIDSSTDFSDPYYLEKGGVLRIITKVKYNKSESNVIERDLVAEIPFKSSDVQPIAPEYTYFVVNSELANNGNDVVNSAPYGTPIEFNKLDADEAFYNDGSVPIPDGSFILHNVPSKNATVAGVEMAKVDFTPFEDGKRIPGMVRINSDGRPSQIRSFFGLVAQPELTEFNKFFTPFDDITNTNPQNFFNTLVSFCWKYEDEDRDTTPQRYHDFELPVYFDQSFTGQEKFGNAEGIKEIMSFLKSANFAIVSVPTLFYGTAHMEYPLGLRVEGPVDTIFSRTRIYIKATGLLRTLPPHFKDKSEVWLDYKKVVNRSDGSAYDFESNYGSEESRIAEKAIPYGMQKYPGYDDGWSDSNTDQSLLPANCYDALQYAKKATKYYETASEFQSDLTKPVANGGLSDGGVISLNGVYYIKEGGITLGGIRYKGNGLIVCKSGIITIDGEIKRDDSDPDINSTLGLIARGSAISFSTEAEIEAACYSNNKPTVPGDLNLYGNLVCNRFEREDIGSNAYVNYDNTLCSVTPLALHRKVGKFEPRRYAIAFAENWSKFKYEKQEEE